MTTRSDTVPLPADQARCFPAHPEPAATRCARNLAALPAAGGTTADYSIEPKGCSVLCDGYIDIQTLRKTAAPQAARPVRPAVKGIS